MRRDTARGLLALVGLATIGIALVLVWKYEMIVAPIGLMLFATGIALQVEALKEDNDG